MRKIRADIHIHSLLSPCASLDMTPAVIISCALSKGLDMIALSDHNTTLHCELAVTLGRESGITVLRAVEVTSTEEAHSVVILPNEQARASFQRWLEKRYILIPNDPLVFGDQVIIDRDENIIGEIEHYLPAAINASIDEVEAAAHSHGGLFIPAHIDRPSMSIISQLGFIPENLIIDAIEVVGTSSYSHYPVIKNSDAHMPSHIGRRYTEYMVEEASFSELAMAIRGEQGRHIIATAG